MNLICIGRKHVIEVGYVFASIDWEGEVGKFALLREVIAIMPMRRSWSWSSLLMDEYYQIPLKLENKLDIQLHVAFPVQGLINALCN